MNQTENILLQLTGRALFDVPTTFDFTTVDWEALYRESANQALTLLIWDALTDAEHAAIPRNVAEKWEQDSFCHIMSNEQLLYEQKQVIQLLTEADIPCAVMKGSSSAECYPESTLRIMGDIDLLVRPEQQWDAVRLLQKYGYGEAEGENHHCHINVKKDGIAVEIHKKPPGLNNVADAAIETRFDDFFSDALDGIEVRGGLPFLSDKHNAVILILHKLGHFLGNELGLRQLCDWAAFVNKKMDAELWNELEPFLKEVGLLTFTGVVTRACVDYLSLPAEKAPWAMEYDNELSDAVMNQIVESGNFGKKAGTYGIGYFTDVHSSNRMASFIKVVFDRCRFHWPVCEKYPILMPVAPFVAYGKYLKLRKEGKRAQLKPVELYKKAGAKQTLYKELKPFTAE